jgi:phosphohistidine swiveling domain-containing protein
MNKELRIMEKYKIIRSRMQDPVPVYWNGLSETLPILEEIHSSRLRNAWQIFQNGKNNVFLNNEEFENSASVISKRIIDDRKYLENIFRQQKRAGERLVKISHIIKKDIQSIDNKKILIEKYKEIMKSWIEFDQLNVTPWYIGAEKFNIFLKNELSKFGLSESEIQKILISTVPSFSSDEYLDMYNSASSYLNKKSEEFLLKKAKTLSLKYYWIPFGYDGPFVNGVEHYKKEIFKIAQLGIVNVKKTLLEKKIFSNNLKKEQSDIYKKYKIKSNLKRLIKYGYVLEEMTDKRKEYTFQAHEAFYNVLLKISDLLKVDYKVLKFVFIDEVENFWNKPEKIINLAHKRMNGFFVIHFLDGKINRMYDGMEAEKIANEILPKFQNVTELKGQVGNKTSVNITGKVKILMSVSDLSKMEGGDILVSPMTTPEFVPAMRRASAIVTDEGGITCHAVIVSRELGIPCIIGTKIATRVLKDGDEVEVDAEKGVVRIIKKVS